MSSRRRIDPSTRLPIGDEGALHANDAATVQGMPVKDAGLAEEHEIDHAIERHRAARDRVEEVSSAVTPNDARRAKVGLRAGRRVSSAVGGCVLR